MNSKERRIRERAPDELKRIMALLPEGWVLLRHGPVPMGWEADLKYGNMLFKLVDDRSYIDVSTLKDGIMKTIEPPDDQKMEITANQVCLLLSKGIEAWESI